MADAVAQLAALLGRVGAVVTLDYDRSTALPCVCCGTTDERAWCLGGLHWNWIVFARRLGTSPWPTTPGGTPTRAIYAYALGGRCRPWNLYRWQIHNGRWEIPDVEPPPCRRGLMLCHEHEDCRRSLALGLACAEGRP